MTIQEFDALFVDSKAAVEIKSTPERQFVNNYYQLMFGLRAFSDTYNSDYPYLYYSKDGEDVVGWNGTKGDRQQQINTIISFKEFHDMTSIPEEDIDNLEEIL